jgi:transposase
MAGFVAGLDRGQTTLLPECLEDWVDENNSARAVDVFVEALDLRDLGFEGVDAAGIGRPSYGAGVLLKLYIYGYLNRVQVRTDRVRGRTKQECEKWTLTLCAVRDPEFLDTCKKYPVP